MEAERLVQMANQIGAFFAAEPDHAAAIEGIANHLRRFWEPRMRKQVVAMVDANDVAGMQPLVVETLRQHHDRLLGQ